MSPHAEELLNLYVDGELALDRQGELFAHLAEDRAARVQFNALMAFRLASRQEALPVPPAADAALMARIDEVRRNRPPAAALAEDRRPFRPLRRRVKLGTALAVGGVLVALSALVGPRGPAPEVVPAAGEVVPVETDGGPVYVMLPGVTVEDEDLRQ